MNKSKGIIAAMFFLAFFILSPFRAQAFQIEKLTDVPVSGDFVLNQTKTEVQLSAGDQAIRSVSLTNRSGADLFFTVGVEDFSASAKAEQNIDLLGAQMGLYSLKDYLKLEAMSFTLHHGERITMPISINIPQNAQPGGLYGAVTFSAKLADAGSAGSSKIQVVSRLASLFFVRVKGEVTESGELLDFNSSKAFYFGGPVAFEFNYKNTGSIYLNPYGELKITDVFGREVYTKWISPYFVMPGAVRQQKEIFERPSAWGLYQATLKLNRGYGNNIDQRSLYFFILPIPYMIGALIALIIIAWLAIRISKGFKKPKVS
ncbi:MAG: hypothetical protein WCT26_04175 [Candidatus Buchananbacteria bacterium]